MSLESKPTPLPPRAWLILRPHPDARRHVRTIAGRTVRFTRLRVRRVEIIDALPTLRFAYVRTRIGSLKVVSVARFGQLASDRARFLSRFLELSGAEPVGTGVPSIGRGDAQALPTSEPDRRPVTMPGKSEPRSRPGTP